MFALYNKETNKKISHDCETIEQAQYLRKAWWWDFNKTQKELPYLSEADRTCKPQIRRVNDSSN